jgi:hypothetical protein
MKTILEYIWVVYKKRDETLLHSMTWRALSMSPCAEEMGVELLGEVPLEPVGTYEKCSPRHHTFCIPSFLELNGIL